MLLYGNVVSVFSYFRVLLLLLLLCLRHHNTLTTGNLFLFVLFFYPSTWTFVLHQNFHNESIAYHIQSSKVDNQNKTWHTSFVTIQVSRTQGSAAVGETPSTSIQMFS